MEQDIEVAETTEVESTDVSTADDGDSEIESVLKAAGVEKEDLDLGDDAEEKPLGQAKKQPAKKAVEGKDLIKKLMGEVEGEEGEEVESDEESEEQSGMDPVLKAVNAMKFTHDGEVFEVKSKDELKTLVQQGQDYTKKTQAVAQEKKEFESLKLKAIEEYNTTIADLNKSIEGHAEQLKQYQIWDMALSSIKQDDPELYEDLINRSKQASKYFQNPVAEAQFNALRKEMDEIKGQTKTREQELIRQQFDAQFGEQAALVDQLDKRLGLKIDKEKVREEWIKSGGNVEKAIGSLYGMQIAKLQASKAKVGAVKAQVGKSGASGASRRTGSANAKKGAIDWNASNDRIVEMIAGML